MLVDNQEAIIGGLTAWQAGAICLVLFLIMLGRDSDDL